MTRSVFGVICFAIAITILAVSLVAGADWFAKHALVVRAPTGWVLETAGWQALGPIGIAFVGSGVMLGGLAGWLIGTKAWTWFAALEDTHLNKARRTIELEIAQLGKERLHLQEERNAIAGRLVKAKREGADDANREFEEQMTAMQIALNESRSAVLHREREIRTLRNRLKGAHGKAQRIAKRDHSGTDELSDSETGTTSPRYTVSQVRTS